MKKLVFFVLITFILAGCGDNCYNPPQPIVFEFVNENHENLLTNGTLSQLSIKDEDQAEVPLTKTDDGKIILENVGAYNGTKNYTFYSSVKSFEFSIQSSEYDGKGCDGYQIDQLTFKGIGIDVTDEKGYYRIIFK